MKTTDKPIFQDFNIDGIKHILPVNAMDVVRKIGQLLY